VSMRVPQGTTSIRVLPYKYDSCYRLAPRVKQLLAGEAEDIRRYTTIMPSYLRVKQLFAGEAEDKRARFVAQPRIEGWSCRSKLINQSNNELIHLLNKAGRERARVRERARARGRGRERPV
jgi:hypothetical protein